MKPLKQMIKRGFFFANEEEGIKNIYTRHNADGTSIKQVKLPDCRKIARVRQSNAKDHNEAAQITDNALQHGIIILSLCTMLNVKKALLSDIEQLSRKDKLYLLVAYQGLNKKD